MQVFLPERTFAECAAVLDQKRLVKQLLEGRQIMQALAGETKGWRNHPATKMFEGYGGTLYSYLRAIRDEMDKRGYKWENNWAEIERIYHANFLDEIYDPPWMVEYGPFAYVRETHRGNLYKKAPDLYPQYYYESLICHTAVCCEGCNYYWPTHIERKFLQSA